MPCLVTSQQTLLGVNAPDEAGDELDVCDRKVNISTNESSFSLLLSKKFLPPFHL